MLTVGTLAITNGSTINIILNSNSTQKTEIVDLGAKVFGLTFKNDNLYVGTWNNKIYRVNL